MTIGPRPYPHLEICPLSSSPSPSQVPIPDFSFPIRIQIPADICGFIQKKKNLKNSKKKEKLYIKKY